MSDFTGRRFTAYITKYALTRGIEEKLVEDCFDTHPDMVMEVAERYPHYYRATEWHRTREAAVLEAEDMRARRMKSLQKSMTRLQEIVF